MYEAKPNLKSRVTSAFLVIDDSTLDKPYAHANLNFPTIRLIHNPTA